MSRNTSLITRSVEFRSAAEPGDGLTLEGYAAVFNQDTEISSWEGTFSERIAKGAFVKTLREKTPVMQFDHGHDPRTGTVPIGVYTELREDSHGLFVAGRLHDNDLVKPIRQAIASGALTGMSFRFRVVKDEWTDEKGRKLDAEAAYDRLYRGKEKLSRTIREVALSEAGPVVSPAYAGTSVGVRDTSTTITSSQAARRLRLLDL
ncbi:MULTISPECIES: HK97 family phage prohead protease [unclassified Rhodococcus (in: high G+C Gram-positive bacteria)]|uniref:HK97 family phage prohead protease n=1 Tax=unclassified Rhodococcus (in: high G+C Gram-positive bacteria) TaxID=192944 RepID=UPI00096A64CA|nr:MULTISPECIES: HK97 family phage prohead protease [unclassified Rhodococcus (in: high G+C Gram-positive bacteria)]